MVLKTEHVPQMWATTENTLLLAESGLTSVTDGIQSRASLEDLSSSITREEQNGKYCRPHNMLCKQPLPLAIRTILGSNANAQVVPTHFHHCLERL